MERQGQAVLQWKGRRLPFVWCHFLDETIGDCARGTAGEGTGETRAVVTKLLQRLTVKRTDGGFRAQEKGRAHLHATGTEGERGCDAATVRNAPGRDNRHGDRVNDLRHQRKGTDIAGLQRLDERPAMTTGIVALRDYGVDAGAFQLSRLGNGGGGAQNDCPLGFQRIDHFLRRQSKVKADNIRSQLENRFHRRLVECSHRRR